MHIFFLLSLCMGLTYAESATTLPPPYATSSVTNFSHVIGWKDGRTPRAPEGFEVSTYATDFKSPRWLYVTPNGDILVAESDTSPIGRANRIMLLRDTKKSGMPDVRVTFLEGLKQPFGMLILNNWFYVANTDSVVRYPYQAGQTKITGSGQKLVDLPANGFNLHWTRNLIASPDASKIYITVGSGSNAGENGIASELKRANILQMNPAGTDLKIYAAGLRNPNGMDWAPGTTKLWTVVNERDGLGDNLVPDYLTSVVENGFYGWPYSY